jgi:manganese transport protein
MSKGNPDILAPGPARPTSHPSLDGIHQTVNVPASGGFWRYYLIYAGPALLVSVGYMDPGNWATGLEAGASFKYGLLWVVAVSSIMAIFLQICSARLGIVTGKDLAQACRDYYPAWTRWPNWLCSELAIAACDLAEILGSAVAIKLLFGIPLMWAVLITAFDVFLLLSLQHLGMRWLEAFVAVLVLTITGCYFVELFILPATQPPFAEMGRALITPSLHNPAMLTVAIGIIGATVMPHNLYLHSALVQTRRFQKDETSIRRALKFNTIDSIVSLFVAFLVNTSILVLAAMVFYGHTEVMLKSGEVIRLGSDWIQEAYLTLEPLLGTVAASVLFAVALLASGQSSTITGTLAGQVVMEGFMHWRIQPWLRRVITRLVAIVPAILVIAIEGDQAVNDLLVLSQVILGIQLPFAMIPLLQFTSSKKRMGSYANGWILLTAGWGSCILITALDVYGLVSMLR